MLASPWQGEADANHRASGEGPTVPRKNKLKQSATISEKTRAEDQRLRKELENADPEKFKKALKPLFRPR